MTTATGDSFPNVEAVAQAIEALGSAIRGDWGSIDGRTIRDSMGGLAAQLRSVEPTTYESLCRMVGVCPVERCWPEHCSLEGQWGECGHMTSNGSSEVRS